MRVIFQWENGAPLGIETEGAAPPVGAVVDVVGWDGERVLADVTRHGWELTLPRSPDVLRTGAITLVVYLRPVAERP